MWRHNSTRGSIENLVLMAKPLVKTGTSLSDATSLRDWRLLEWLGLRLIILGRRLENRENEHIGITYLVLVGCHEVFSDV
jgi:hypothetical protein